MNEFSDLLAGRTALIPGGTGNVGRVLVDGFLRSGATVVVPSRSSTKLTELRENVGEAATDRLITLEGDIGDADTAASLVERIADRHGPIDAAVASLGGFVPVPSVLEASADALRRVIDDYLMAHFIVARAVIPALVDDGSFTSINGPLAFQPMSPGAALVSIATAGQAMLARTIMEEIERVRVNEVVLYTPFGWSDDDAKKGLVSQRDVARYVCHLASDRGADVRGRTIHLKSLEPLEALGETA